MRSAAMSFRLFSSSPGEIQLWRYSMRYLIDPANLKGGPNCKKKQCDALCSLCSVFCAPHFIPLYGIDPVPE